MKSFFVLLFYSTQILCQEIDINEAFFSDLEKNMTTYRIYYAQGLDSYRENQMKIIDHYILDEGKHYDVEVISTNLINYPKKNIDLLS